MKCRNDNDNASNVHYDNTSDHKVVQLWTVKTNHPVRLRGHRPFLSVNDIEKKTDRGEDDATAI